MKKLTLMNSPAILNEGKWENHFVITLQLSTTYFTLYYSFQIHLQIFSMRHLYQLILNTIAYVDIDHVLFLNGFLRYENCIGCESGGGQCEG